MKYLSSSLALVFPLIAVFSTLAPATCEMDSFVYGGCSQFKYSPGSAYESSVNTLFTSLVNSANSVPYNNFTMTGSSPGDTIYGFFQCQGDLSPSSCFSCVSHAVTQLGALCVKSSGGALQLQGCLVKYDNTTFLGVEDKTALLKKCGPLVGYASVDLMTRRDAVLAYIGTDDGTYKPFRFSGSEGVQAEVQCVQDLDQGECQDCITEAILQLKTVCGGTKWGDMYLAKCYARFWYGGDPSSTSGSGNRKQLNRRNFWCSSSMFQFSLLLCVVLATFKKRLAEFTVSA